MPRRIKQGAPTLTPWPKDGSLPPGWNRWPKNELPPGWSKCDLSTNFGLPPGWSRVQDVCTVEVSDQLVVGGSCDRENC